MAFFARRGAPAGRSTSAQEGSRRRKSARGHGGALRRWFACQVQGVEGVARARLRRPGLGVERRDKGRVDAPAPVVSGSAGAGLRLEVALHEGVKEVVRNEEQ